jgi:hypothetical protein
MDQWQGVGQTNWLVFVECIQVIGREDAAEED